jgi:splicing factor 3B subunit 2
MFLGLEANRPTQTPINTDVEATDDERQQAHADVNQHRTVNGESSSLEVKPPMTDDGLPETMDNSPDLALLSDDPAFAEYKNLLARFGTQTDDASEDETSGNKGEIFYDDDDEIPEEEDEEGAMARTRLSKKKLKKLNKLSVAELKSLVKNPEVVEWNDVSSSDPRLLVQIKAQRNIVPVPTHWSLKREYLSSKRGIEKPPFRLPKFISETGITEMRDAVLEKQAEQTLKQKQRERVQPKMGKLDIDYQKLYDAFFRFQTKPDTLWGRLLRRQGMGSRLPLLQAWRAE